MVGRRGKRFLDGDYSLEKKSEVIIGCDTNDDELKITLLVNYIF